MIKELNPEELQEEILERTDDQEFLEKVKVTLSSNDGVILFHNDDGQIAALPVGKECAIQKFQHIEKELLFDMVPFAYARNFKSEN